MVTRGGWGGGGGKELLALFEWQAGHRKLRVGAVAATGTCLMHGCM